jgi:uncharacterized protein YegP (UPF0339 family)
MGAYTVYRDKSGYWRWRYKARNGKIISDSGEGYVNKSDCQAGINIMKGSTNDPVYEE